MPKAFIQLDEFKKLRSDIRRAEKETRLAVKELDKVTAQEIAQASLKYVPVKSGRLKRSVKGAGEASGAIVKAGNNTRLKYASVQHWGWPTRKIRRSGFILRGMVDIGRERGGDFANLYIERLERILNKEIK